MCTHPYTHTHSERGEITEVLISESLVLPCSCGQHTHTHIHTLFNPNIFGSSVYTHSIAATNLVIQHDTNLVISLDDNVTGLKGNWRSECANLLIKIVCHTQFGLEVDQKAVFTG